MERDYESGKADDAVLFIGTEVEQTPAFGLRTLFVKGIQRESKIKEVYKKHNCRHLFFGANHSFNPTPGVADEWTPWENLILNFLKEDYLCTLDIPINCVEGFHDGGLCEYDNFIPQIRVPIPYVNLWNYNTMVKIDDKGFRETNPGVWCHSLHDLMAHEKFTDWLKYKNDIIIE